MNTPAPDTRSPLRRARDEQIASEPPLPLPEIPPGTVASPVEVYLASRRRTMAVPGIVENGLVRPLDPGVRLPEHSRVIIVASEG